MGAMNKFLGALQTKETRERNEANRHDQDDQRGEVLTMGGGKYWRNDLEETEKGRFRVVNNGLEVVKGGKNHGRNGETLAISAENRWKSARNGANNRPVSLIQWVLASGGVVTALYSTYCECDLQTQATAYLIAIGLVMAIDPLKMFSRLLARFSRWIIGASLAGFSMTLWSDQDGLKRVCYIAIGAGALVILLLNSFWVKEENFLMSKSVELAIHGDPDNRGGKSWQSGGRRKVWTALDTIGVIAKDDDIDTVFKLVYLVGFWECFKKQQDQSKEIEQLNIALLSERATKEQAIARGKADLEEQLERLTAKYNGLVNEFNDLVDERDELEDELTAIREATAEVDEDEETEETAEVGDGFIIPDLPSWLTAETYQQVIELLDKNEPKRNIERLTGVTRYRIDQIRALREEAEEANRYDQSEKVVAFG